MTANPYLGLPETSYWKKSVSSVPFAEIDPVIKSKFQIDERDFVASAGSCFAQHISRHLVSSGFQFLVTERAHPIVPAGLQQEYCYGLFSARFGNIYTARQLLQLLRRAYGNFQPAEDIWRNSSGAFFDPFRPSINPNGFSTRREYYLDREQHFAAIRRMFEELDIFVFTLGLTECWNSSVDGAVFPTCPGTIAGEFDSEIHEFSNHSVQEVRDDLNSFLVELKRVNSHAKVVLTVSPVPLIATYEQQHVLVATSLSKSVLRVAADEAARAHENVDYFPSYEIITSAFSRGKYWGDDLRAVTEGGVSHVMRVFLKHYTGLGTVATAVPDIVNISAENAPSESITQLEEMSKIVAVMCDEERVALGDSQTGTK